jgi:hypothetical protein
MATDRNAARKGHGTDSLSLRIILRIRRPDYQRARGSARNVDEEISELQKMAVFIQ